MRTMVVDASVAAACILPEKHSEAALRLADTWLQEGVAVVAPALFAADLANALHQRVRRGEMSLETAARAMDLAASFDIQLREEAGVPARALELATKHARPSAYDCFYLALAETLDCEYWTNDERFFDAVSATEARVRFIGADGP